MRLIKKVNIRGFRSLRKAELDGFGSPRDVEKWQARYHVIWLATPFDTDEGSDMRAVLWRSVPGAKKRRR